MRSLIFTSVFILLAVFTKTVSWAQTPFGGLPLTGEVKQHLGSPTIHINGKPQIPYIYALTDVPGGRWTWEEVPQWNIKQFCEAGVRQFYFPIFFEDMWSADGRLDISRVQRQVRGVHEVCPGAAMYLRFHFHMPEWWRDQHPEEMTVYADVKEYQVGVDYGLKRIIDDDFRAQRRESLASERWLTDATQITIAFLEAFQKTPEADYLVGIHIAGGVYGEWHYWGFMYNEPDFSSSMQDWYRNWLTKKYKNDKTLQQTWQRNDATLSSAKIPDIQDRVAGKGLFRDPVKERWVSDYYRAQHELVTNRILHFAALVKQHWNRPIIVGTFWGYYFSVFGRDAAGGHLDYHTVLRSPHIDYVSSPQVYEPDDHLPGHPYRSRGLLQTVRLHGKVWLDEMDQQPVLLSKVHMVPYRTELDNSIAVMRRNVLYSLTRGNGLWYFDFGPAGVLFDNPLQRHRGKYGWWDHPELIRDVKAIREIYERQLEKPYKTEADVLFVYDTEVFYHTASRRFSDALTNTAINWSTLAAHYSGAVFDAVHLDDLDKLDLTPYKVIVFGNTYRLTKPQAQLIKKKVANNQRHLVWFYAPGYHNGSTLSVDGITNITGIQIQQVADAPQIPHVLPDTLLIPKAKAFTLKRYYATPDTSLSPLFVAKDPKAIPYGYFRDTQTPAIVKKSAATHTNWYSSLPITDAVTFRRILEEAGVHLYTTQTGDVVYAGNGLLVYHTKRGGRHELKLKNGKTIIEDLPSTHAVTLVYDATTGVKLLQDGSK